MQVSYWSRNSASALRNAGWLSMFIMCEALGRAMRWAWGMSCCRRSRVSGKGLIERAPIINSTGQVIAARSLARRVGRISRTCSVMVRAAVISATSTATSPLSTPAPLARAPTLSSGEPPKPPCKQRAQELAPSSFTASCTAA